ncbi:hypothetical protein I307_03188 [Cryptococcus deuterogattii 99/473]|uniref:Trafficking protein particle complex subunit n=1 Tax=Cryptococcus deuterogattii Ram5 TaxID=1296110 RepID=A0A0D0TYV9_9TREE|nr:hypothetical protein I313_03059 [Cryptococcus deuterogattii Ram5]KIY57269.1 hypothetical protein I307_03188 [Cryptococcus deuterogattii 99/473]
MSFYLAVVSPNDAPLFELAFSSTKPPPPATAASTSSFPSWSAFTTSNSSSSSSIIGGGGDAASHDAARPTTSGPLMESKSAPQRDRAMCQMVAHMSLDSVEEIMEGTGALYLKGVDRYNEWIVSAFIPTGVKFVLLHDIKNDDGIRLFFIDLWEAYIKILLNPFFTVNTPIKNPAFEARVRAIAKRHL